jgi:prolycopene isomerase
MKTKVASIDVENGSVCGITTTDGDSFTAPIVISSAGIRQTVLKLVGENYFHQDYVERIRNLESNLACIGFRYFVSQPVLKNETNVFFPYKCLEPWSKFENMAQGKSKPSHNYIYLGTKSIHPGISPDGKQIIYACMSCHPDPQQDVEPYLDYIEKELKGIVPELFLDGIIERKEIMGLEMVSKLGTDSIFPGQGGESYGIANSIGQTGPTQPKCETPIKGLYIVGNDAGGFGVGTHQAVDSGYTVFNLLRSPSKLETKKP